MLGLADLIEIVEQEFLHRTVHLVADDSVDHVAEINQHIDPCDQRQDNSDNLFPGLLFILILDM